MNQILAPAATLSCQPGEQLPNVGEKDDLPKIVFEQIEHFFTHYKDLEKKKWVRVGTWGGREEARRITMEAVDRYNSAKNAGDEAPGMDKAEGEREERAI